MADIIQATDAIITRLREQWLADTPAITGTAPELVTEGDEADVKPHPSESANPWARVTVRHASGRARALGNKNFSRTGTLYVQIFVPHTTGEAYTTAQRLAAVAQNAYEGKQAGGVLFPSVAVQERGREGTYWRADVVASFEYHEFKT